MNILALSTNYPYHQNVLQSMKEKGAVIKFATSHRVDKDMKNCPFYQQNNVQLIDGSRFYRVNDLSKIVPADAPALEKPMLDYFENVERDFYIISDRYSYYPKPFRYRKRLFRHAIRFWLDFYSKNKIDLVYSVSAPHNFPDFLAYHVAKYLGIKTLHTTDVVIDNHVLVANDYREQLKVPDNFMQGASREEIIAQITPKLYSDYMAESRHLIRNRIDNDKAIGALNLNHKAADKECAAQKKAKRQRRFERLTKTSQLQPKFKAAFAMNGEYSDFFRKFVRVNAHLRNQSIRKFHDSLAVEPDLTKKYVYFAMHLYPERMVQPEAGVFEDYLAAVEILSQSVPADWVIYVKENPGQFTRQKNLLNCKHYRDKTDYIEMTRRPNVKIVKQAVKSSDLIKNAAVISTPKGSVGWEAMKENGKPCLIFANAWYSPCASAYLVDSVESCKAAIAAIAAKTKDDVELDLLKFLAYMSGKISIGSMGGKANLANATVPYETLYGELAGNILKRAAS